MNKVHALAAIALLAAGCNNSKKDGTSGATAGSAGSSSVAPLSTTSLLQSAMSFLSGGPFEGEITMAVTSVGKPPQTIVYEVKGQKMRFVAPSSRGVSTYTIFDGSTRKLMTVTDAQKTVMVVDLNGPMPTAAGAGGGKAAIDRTGKSDTIAGYSCDVWKVTEPGGEKTDLCVAHGIAFPSMGQGSGTWMSELGDGFPLRAVTTAPSGVEKTRMEVTKIDKKTIDDAQFTVPADYKTMDMSAMLGGLIKRP
jgi:hypothetical protein